MSSEFGSKNDKTSSKLLKQGKWIIASLFMTFYFCLQLSIGPNPLRRLLATPYDVSVVISYCDEDVNAFTNYINEWSTNVNVENITIISRCPHLYPHNIMGATDPFINIHHNEFDIIQSHFQYPDLNFLQWLERKGNSYYDRQQKGRRLFEEKENSVILFMKATTMQRQDLIRKLDDIIQSTKENGFECVLRPFGTLSAYHYANELKQFMPQFSNVNYNLGKWLNELEGSLESKLLDDKKVVPVCYGSSFAINARDLLSRINNWYPAVMSIEANFSIGNEIKEKEAAEYVERIWGALFSYDLSEEKVESLTKDAKEYGERFPYNGALMPK